MSNSPSNPFIAVLAALSRRAVRYVVISGQACLHYGAIEATRDVDLWVEPADENLARLRAALNDLGAEQRFLPPLEKRFLNQGHAVHFMIPADAGEYRLDLMGRPPRVGDFAQAWDDAVVVTVEGIQFRVLDIPRLVDIKKTQRPRDYDVICRLLEPLFEHACAHPEEQARIGPWLAKELRTPESLLAMAATWPQGPALLRASGRPACVLAAEHPEAHQSQDERVLDAIVQELRREQQALEDEDRAYWRRRLAELRRLPRT